MKQKTVWIILSCIGVMLLSFASSLGYHYYADNANPAQKDSIYVVSEDTLADNPAMMSVEEVLQNHRGFCNDVYYDSVYLSIPEEILINVTKVVIGRFGKATVPDIVQEYLKNFQSLYRYLPTPAQSIPEEPAIAPQVRDTIKIPATKDTVINGEHFKIIVELRMTKETRALIILFCGEEVDEITRGLIITHLRKHCTSDSVEMIQLGSDEITKAIIEKVCKPDDETKSSAVIAMRTPEDEAVIFIGTVMKDELSHFNAAHFISALTNKMAEASVNPHTEENKQFMNALFILSKEDLVISQSLLKKYKLNQQRIALIKKVYTLSASF